MTLFEIDLKPWTTGFDRSIDAAMAWLTDNSGGLFDALRATMEGLFGGATAILLWIPFWGVAGLAGLIAWRALGWKAAIASALGFLCCWAIGLWPQTMETMALVLISVTMAVLIGLPLGILSAYRKRVERVMEPFLDLLQTLPPYIYLLPAIAFLGYGPATAVVATVIVSVPPVIRLTALGFRMTPHEFIELGEASGATPRDIFFKIRIPFARPSIMAGINQSLMIAFGMVVIAGIVGSGGLGQTIYGAIRKLNVALSVNAAIAIVILTIIIDRISQSAGTPGGKS